MSTFCLHNNSGVRVGVRGRVKGCQVGRTCHLLRVLGSWVKGEETPEDGPGVFVSFHRPPSPLHLAANEVWPERLSITSVHHRRHQHL